jgi:hypothetical protein
MILLQHPNFNSIDNGNFDIFYTSHNINNGDNETIYTYFVCSCSWSIRPDEDLPVGKIIDNGSPSAR